MLKNNADWFRGEKSETTAALAAAEKALGCTLPPSLKWLLVEWGYSEACGVDDIAGTVQDTLRFRQKMKLPDRYILLNDWHDTGVVFFDATAVDSEGEYKIYWAGAHNIHRLARGDDVDTDAETFDNYPAWVVNRLEAARDDAAYYEDEDAAE
jgi:hypothetical protein